MEMSVPGSNIRTLRLQAGLSIRALAKAAGLDHGNLSKLEAGKIGYSEETIAKLAEILGVSYGVLFAEPEKVEAAGGRTRSVPVLTSEQLTAWRGPDDAEYGDEQAFLEVSLQRASRHSFAMVIDDDANAPRLLRGDELVLDPKASPENGDFVVVEYGKQSVHIGRIQLLSRSDFQVIPERLDAFPVVSTLQSTKCWLRGTAVEWRRPLRRNPLTETK